MNKRFAAALAGGACLLSANPAFAGTAATVLNLSANISPRCEVKPDSSQLNFGELRMNSTNRANTMVRVSCNVSDDVRPTIMLRSSNGIGGNFRMVGDRAGAEPIQYGVRFNNEWVAGGYGFEMPSNGNGGDSVRDQYLSIEAIVDTSMGSFSRYGAGSYSDQLTVEVSY